MRKLELSGKTEKRLIDRIAEELKKNAGLYVLALVPLIYLILFKYWPIYGVQIAFRNYTPAKGVAQSEWVGLKYIWKFLQSPKFVEVMRNTLVISLYSLCTFPIPILLAVLLNYLPSKRYRKAIQMVSYMPHFISTVVMVGVLLQFLDRDNGMINLILEALGFDRVHFMADRNYFYHIYIWSGVWQNAGYNAIIYISALASVPLELHEAAIVDGASIVKRILHIDLPCILPTICVLLILNCGSILNVGYEKIYLLQNSLNIKYSEVISTYVYKQGLTASVPQYSYSAAIGLFVSVINALLLLSVNKITKELSGNGLW